MFLCSADSASQDGGFSGCSCSIHCEFVLILYDVLSLSSCVEFGTAYVDSVVK